jgi:hypothetical protein
MPARVSGARANGDRKRPAHQDIATVRTSRSVAADSGGFGGARCQEVPEDGAKNWRLAEALPRLTISRHRCGTCKGIHRGQKATCRTCLRKRELARRASGAAPMWAYQGRRNHRIFNGMKPALGTDPKSCSGGTIRARAAYQTPEKSVEDARNERALAEAAQRVINRATSNIQRRRFGHTPKSGQTILAALGTPKPETLAKALDAGQWEITLAAADVHAGPKWKPQRWALANALARVGATLGDWWWHVRRVCSDARVFNPGAAIARWVIPEVLAGYRDVIATLVPPKPKPAMVATPERMAAFAAARAAWKGARC